MKKGPGCRDYVSILPTEILVQILRYLLRQPPPTKTEIREKQIRHRKDIEIEYQLLDYDYDRDLRKARVKDNKFRCSDALGVLRVSKLFYRLGTEILYGEHKFFLRDTQLAWIWFLQHIGVANTAKITSLSLEFADIMHRDPREFGRKISNLARRWGRLQEITFEHRYMIVQGYDYPASAWSSSFPPNQNSTPWRYTPCKEDVKPTLLTIGATIASKHPTLKHLTFFDGDEGGSVGHGEGCLCIYGVVLVTVMSETAKANPADDVLDVEKVLEDLADGRLEE